MAVADVVAAAMLGALVLYALTAGADFGGGVWDLFASGPRAGAQRKLIEQAIAPVWEANHVWLILVVVLLFTAFPPAFAAVSVALHVPMTLLLLGIVFRGAAFVFRQYGGGGERAERRWGRVFAVASVVTPFFLGVSLGALTSGALRFERGVPEGGFFRPWIAPFPLSVGAFTLSLFAFLAAVYLTAEAEDPLLRDDFRRRALVSGLVVGAFALLAALTAAPGAVGFRARLFGCWWSWPLQIATGLCATGVFAALILRRFRLARAVAAAQVALIVVGWGAAQYPYLVAPGITIQAAAAPDETLRLLVLALAAGAIVLFPSLYVLLRVFKSRAPGA